MHRRLQRNYQLFLFHSIVFSALPVYHGLSPRRWGDTFPPLAFSFLSQFPRSVSRNPALSPSGTNENLPIRGVTPIFDHWVQKSSTFRSNYHLEILMTFSRKMRMNQNYLIESKHLHVSSKEGMSRVPSANRTYQIGMWGLRSNFSVTFEGQ